jgi:hypothetical protein
MYNFDFRGCALSNVKNCTAFLQLSKTIIFNLLRVISKSIIQNLFEKFLNWNMLNVMEFS